MEGWVCIPQSLLEESWWKDINTRLIFIHCLLSANNYDNDVDGFVIPQGSFITTTNDLSAKIGLTHKQVRIALHKLSDLGIVSVTTHAGTNRLLQLTIKRADQRADQKADQRANRFTMITICNYEFYKDEKFQEGTAKGRPKGTAKENKKEIEKEKEKSNIKKNKEKDKEKSKEIYLTSKKDFDRKKSPSLPNVDFTDCDFENQKGGKMNFSITDEIEKEKSCAKKEKENTGDLSDDFFNNDKLYQSETKVAETAEKGAKTARFPFKAELTKLVESEKHSDDYKQTIADWMMVRERKKAVNSKTAFNRVKNQMDMARAAYLMTYEDCVRTAAEKSWIGFEASWMGNMRRNKQQEDWLQMAPASAYVDKD